MSTPEEKIMSLAEAAEWAKSLQKEGKRLAVTNGVFDLIHAGHIKYLQEAANQADALLVAINSDASVKQLKGPERPIVNEEDHAYILASLECVSAIVVFDSTRPLEVFSAIHPNVYVKGGDYTEETLDKDEHALLKSGGASFSFIKFVEGHSTTSVIKKIREGISTDVATDNRLSPILSRRSVRKFQLRPVGKEQIVELLKAAMAAPSACGKNPWHFEIVTAPERLRELASFLPNGSFLSEASACICVVGDISKAHGGELSYMLQDCSAATENILIAAPLLGLGACWLGVHPRQPRIDALKQFFNLSDNFIPFCCIALGWPGEHPQARTKYDESAVHFDS